MNLADLSTFSSTAGRYGQRIIAATAAQNRWPLVSADVGNAFLRGMTFKELAEYQGTQEREVCMEMPTDTIPLLREFKQFASFNITFQALKLDKPGYGLNDAPRAWSLKLRQHMTSVQQMYPCKTDDQIYVATENNQLKVLVSAHVDDLKITAPKETIERIVKMLHV